MKIVKNVKLVKIVEMKALVGRHLSRIAMPVSDVQTEKTIEKILENDPSVVKVDLDRCKLSNISFMEFNVTVTRLVISYNRIQDLSPLQSNRTLQELDISNNLIEDLSPLKSIVSLSILNLYGNKIRDISPLRGMTKLFILNIGKNDIIDLSPLWGNTSLEYVNTAWNPYVPKKQERTIRKMSEMNRDNSVLRRIRLKSLALYIMKNSIYHRPRTPNFHFFSI